MQTSMTPQINAGAVEENIATTISIQSSDSVDAVGFILSSALSCQSGSKTVYINAELYCNDIT